MEIEPLDEASADAIARHDGGNGWKRSHEAWSKVLRGVKEGRRTTLVASTEEGPIGYGSLLWRSEYPPFEAKGVPEIHDVTTSKAFRRRGIATALIRRFEDLATQRSHRLIGLGVGLYADYGDAQRLYASLGFLPDGRGITHRHVPVRPGSSATVDDDLILWVTKPLRPVLNDQ